jgi:hypothetical protein
MGMDYYEKAYKAGKTEIEEILKFGFDLPDKDFYRLEKHTDGIAVRCPGFLIAHPEIQAFLFDLETIDPVSGSPIEISTKKDNIEQELADLTHSATDIFQAVQNVLVEFVEAEYKRIQESDKEFLKKVQRLESLKENAISQIKFFRGKEQPTTIKSITGLLGLIWGTPIEDCLDEIYKQEALVSVLQDGNIKTGSFFNINRKKVDLQKLKELQELAVPKVKEYIRVQVALNKDQTVPEYIEKAIHKVALEVSKGSPKNDFETIYNALALFHSTNLDGKKVAKKIGVPSNTFSTWKTKLDAKL